MQSLQNRPVKPEFLKKNDDCRTIGPTLSVSAGSTSFLPNLNTSNNRNF